MAPTARRGRSRKTQDQVPTSRWISGLLLATVGTSPVTLTCRFSPRPNRLPSYSWALWCFLWALLPAGNISTNDNSERPVRRFPEAVAAADRSEEHTSELQSLRH